MPDDNDKNSAFKISSLLMTIHLAAERLERGGPVDEVIKSLREAIARHDTTGLIDKVGEGF